METNNLPEVTKKQNAFASYAVESHNLLSSLQTEAAKVIATLSDLPTDISKITDAEATLKTSKAELKVISGKRLAQTSKLDKFFENFMAPEKSIAAAVPAFEQAIIKLKNEKATADQLEVNKIAELKRLKESFLVHVNNTKSNYEAMIADYIAARFAYALKHAKDADTIVVEGKDMKLSDYLMKCQCSKKLSDFEIRIPAATSTHHDINTVWRDTCFDNVYLDGKLMLGKFEGDLKDKFKYFGIALKDKEKALAHNESQANEAKEQAATQAEQMNVGAKLSASASVLDNGPAVKPLNEKFEIDMPSSEKNAITIMVAFTTNIDKVRSKVKADWMKLSVAQMGAALAAVKNDDNNFSVSGINFKVIQKL